VRAKFLRVCGFFLIASLLVLQEACGYWVWTPTTKKFINPKYAVKDTPKEQFDWAMNFFNAKDYSHAADEFEKLVKHYEYSDYAADAQYYAGLSYENQGKYYFAFQRYQKVIDEYPHSARFDEVIEREFRIGNIYLSKINSKLLGTEIMTPLDRAIEIFRKVAENSPYGPYADKAQYRLGLSYKRAELYEEAILAFQRLLDEYPASELAEKARYEVASCAYKASLKPAYDSGPTEKAITVFKEFVESNRDKELEKEADETLKRLTDNMAEKSFSIAKFYEKQKHYASAIVYYKEVLERYPTTSFAKEAASKIEVLKNKAEKRK
jgi:outer membrane assembly lipoprotein YfiO